MDLKLQGAPPVKRKTSYLFNVNKFRFAARLIFGKVEKLTKYLLNSFYRHISLLENFSRDKVSLSRTLQNSGSSNIIYTLALRVHYLRNRKHFPCFYRVIETRVEVWENEKCCGNTSRRRVFPQLFRVLPNLHECFYNSIETRRKCFLFLLENSPRKITKNEENLIVLFIIKT